MNDSDGTINSDDVIKAVSDWAQQVTADIGAQGAFLFGSLVYKNGAQFNHSSDVDLVIGMPELTGPVSRHRWLSDLAGHKGVLEKELIMPTHKHSNDEPSASILPITQREVEADVHKDGHREFFSKNQFAELPTLQSSTGLKGAGSIPIDRFTNSALGFVQRFRNEFLSVSPNGTGKIQIHMGSDPIPKKIMRAAAMANRALDSSLDDGAEYDVAEGLEVISNYLYRNRGNDPKLKVLQEKVSARRGARTRQQAFLDASDQLLLAEIVYELLLGNASSMVQLTSDSEAPTNASVAKMQSNEESDSLDAVGDVLTGTSEIVGESSTAFFQKRFTSAFPGMRSLTWIEDKTEISARLLELLRAPLRFADGTPIWWWRDGNLQIESFSKIDEDIFLMNYEELKISHVAAVPGRSYKQNFVYVEVEEMPPTGLYPVPSTESREKRLEFFGYDTEEYGLYKNKNLLTRGEYDDGAALRDGVLIRTASESELRIRHITPYNFIIAPHGSPINNPNFDGTLASILNQALLGNREYHLSELADRVLKLPMRSE
jgi:hypothetical protein